jgi:hypothetical protein
MTKAAYLACSIQSKHLIQLLGTLKLLKICRVLLIDKILNNLKAIKITIDYKILVKIKPIITYGYLLLE